MNKLSRLIFATTLLVAAPFAFACDYPQPPEIPEGATASKEEMVAASKAVKAYQGDMVSYRECIDAESTAKVAELEIGEADEETIKNNKMAAAKKYNASVDEEELVVARFNEAVRAYKAQGQ
jgi:hypothetical protein